MLRLLPTCLAATRLRSRCGRGALLLTRGLTESVAIANRIAPEHLELAVADPDALLPSIRHAGAIFVGVLPAKRLAITSEGRVHALPTFGTARFASPTGRVRLPEALVGDSMFSRRRRRSSGTRLVSTLAIGEGVHGARAFRTGAIRGIDVLRQADCRAFMYVYDAGGGRTPVGALPTCSNAAAAVSRHCRDRLR